MSGYTTEEINAATDRFLLRVVSVGILPGGLRDVNAARDLVYDLLTTALVLKPEAYFYLVWLARNAAYAAVTQQIAAVDTIIAAAAGVSRPTKVVNSTTDLTNARAALTDLNAGLNARAVGVRGSLGPGVERFRRSVTSFINSELTKNVVVSGEVTETATELREKILTTWTAAIERDDDITSRLGGITNALTTLSRVSLPETTIASIVARMNTRLIELESQMSSVTAVRDSRMAMLDLLAMRSLLAKVSNFRSPQVKLMPVGNEVAAAELLDSEGVEPSLLGTVSAPFNYSILTSLELTVSGAPVISPLPGQSVAEIRSRVMGFPTGPAAPWDLDVTVDFTNPVLLSGLAGPYATGPAAAAALDAASPLLTVFWDASSSQLVFQSANDGDDSALEFSAASTDAAAFVAWALPAIPLTARAAPVAAETAVAALTSPLIGVEAQTTSYPAGDAVLTGLDEIDFTKTLATGAEINDSVLSSSAVNFVAAGVRRGDAVVVTVPAAATYIVKDVTPQRLTLENAPNTSGVSFSVGPDLAAVPTGARVRVISSSARATGWYRVLTVAGLVVTLDRNIPDAPTTVEASIFTTYLRVTALGASTTTTLAAPSSTGGIALGLFPLAAAGSELSRFSTALDPLGRGVQPGATATLVSPSSVEYERLVTDVGVGEFSTEPVPYEAGIWSFIIYSSAGLAFSALADGLSAVSTVDRSVVDFAVTRLISGARYVGSVAQALSSYRAQLVSQAALLSAYTVPEEPGISAVIKMLQEQGFDRMLDILLRLDIDVVFSMPREGASYATHLVRTLATAVREVTPVTKYAKSPLGYQEIRPTSFQLRVWQDSEEP